MSAMSFRTSPRPVTQLSLTFRPSSFQSQPSYYRSAMRQASSRAPVTDKSRILEKPTKFNPPSHGARIRKPRSYGGPRLSDADLAAQKTKRYPNMMPNEGTFAHYFLTDRRIHLWITLSTLTTLAIFAMVQSFLHTTAFRDQVPAAKDFWSRPFSSLVQLVDVYKLHVAHESEKVAEKRRKKLDDVQKRKEFLREHGVEPGFLTGTWMDKFGTVEGDEAKARIRAKSETRQQEQAQDEAEREVIPVSVQASPMAEGPLEETHTAERKSAKRWLGIW